jgi:hypothetical protein
MENVIIFYDHLEYFMAFWHNVCQFGKVCGHLVYFFPFWYVWTKKNLATVGGGRPPVNLLEWVISELGCNHKRTGR